jgi:benzoyl-CoA reductase/2-hydroxyglutaryl-CoA dehydratase subunit BcrC/BadD/HgdB
MSDLTPNKFAFIIENMVKEKKISYIDAILEYCKTHEIDPSNTKSMINKTLKEKVAYEAQNLNMLKEKVAKLPL